MGFARTKQRIDTEKLLHWAFRDELPKIPRRREALGSPGYPAISPMFRIADLGTRVDEWTEEPGLPRALGDPHPDALIIESAVMSLDDAPIAWPATRATMMGPLAGLLSDTDPALAKLNIACPGLVAMHAKMGTRPQWDIWPRPEPVKNEKNGKPSVRAPGGKSVKASGGASGVPWYPAGSYSPLAWWPIPREAAFVRIEYSIWWQAVDTLADHLCGMLQSYDPLPPAAHPSPWMRSI